MRKALSVWICLLLLGAVGLARQRGADGTAPGEALVGTWTGTWEGAGSSGGFELTLEKTKDGPLGGGVSVTGEPAYKAALKTVSFDGPTMTARYDFPAAENVEVVLVAKFDASTATGTWTAREKPNGGDVANGTWTVKKQ